MRSSDNLRIDEKFVIDERYVSEANRTAGEQKQRRRTQDHHVGWDGKRRCVACGKQIDWGADREEYGCDQGYWHHLITRAQFPSKFDCDDGLYSNAERKSQHHLSNCVILCSRCHGLWEGWENGRPHIMTWLFKDVTGEEIPLMLSRHAESRRRAPQRSDWNATQLDAERKYGYECKACGHQQRKDITSPVYDGDRLAFTYTGRDVRALHIVPPVVDAKLMHDLDNLVLLCWSCLFGGDARNAPGERNSPLAWKDQPTEEWLKAFKPSFYRLASQDLDDA